MNDIAICGTGHRPAKIIVDGGRNAFDRSVFERMVDLAAAALGRERATLAISGMALGWDMAFAEAALRVGIPFDAYVPFRGQELRWPKPSQDHYRRLLSHARSTVIVSEGPYAAWKMQSRNEVMVDTSHRVLALWNGAPGGTANCVDYAQRVGRPIVNLWRSWTRFA